MIKIYGIASATIYKWNDLYKKDDDTGASKAELLEMQTRIAKLESENDILKKSLNHIRKKVSIKDWQLAIKVMAPAHSVKEVCQTLHLCRSTYYQHQLTKSQ
ncbi:hypothetical protein [Liquorilactobacillus ghanensis]|nr:hypothetical protein [Liquorilactobacillus ghanensis]